MRIEMTPIGVFRTSERHIPRHWSVSNVRGEIAIDAAYQEGLRDIAAGQRIVVLFYFHKSSPFDPKLLIQTSAAQHRAMGVFSICSPHRPNPIGLSVLEVLSVSGNRIAVNHADMLDGTPILDIKPHIEPTSDTQGV
jgi:tRNA (adenine37-N6)-methyltransferase